MTRRLRLRGSPHALGGVLLLPLAGCAQPPSAAPYLASPIPSGMARIWFYRDMNPDELAGTPYVRLNGTPTGSAEPGAAVLPRYDARALSHQRRQLLPGPA